jgi:hypothetical protein
MLMGFLSWWKVLIFNLKAIATGVRLSHEASCPSGTEFGLESFLGVEPRSVETALADGLCNLWGGDKPL